MGKGSDHLLRDSMQPRDDNEAVHGKGNGLGIVKKYVLSLKPNRGAFRSQFLVYPPIHAQVPHCPAGTARLGRLGGHVRGPALQQQVAGPGMMPCTVHR
jgi:hypothetical protein